MNSSSYDLAVIGGGSAGYAAARTAVAGGLRTVVIDGSKELGGLCILRGCMPTKSLLYATDVLHLVRQAETWGVRTRDVRFDLLRAMARKDALISEFANYRRQQLTQGKFELIRDHARFADPHTVALSDGRMVVANSFILCTGSVVAPPPLPQLGQIGYLTSDDALSLDRLPRSLIVLGGGAVAVEFAQVFVRVGVKVPLVQRCPQLLRDFDADVAAELQKVFQREGMTVFTGTKLLDAWRDAGLKWVSFEHRGQVERVAADEILFALGRVPAIANLELDKAGVATDGGRILTNTEMQTSAPHIFAAGDCTGPHEIVHIAIQQGEIAAHNLTSPARRRSIDYRLLLHVVFTDPQVAVVGLTEKEAQARQLPCFTARYPFNDHGKALIMEAKDGFVKLLADPASGEILGGSCVGPSGGELIHEIVAAMHQRMTVHELATMPHYHPTLAEIWTYPAEELAEKTASRR